MDIQETKAAYLQALTQGMTEARAAKFALVNLADIAKLRDREPFFDLEVRCAIQSGIGSQIEDEAIRLALHGDTELLLVKGRPVFDPKTGDFMVKKIRYPAILVKVLEALNAGVYDAAIRAKNFDRMRAGIDRIAGDSDRQTQDDKDVIAELNRLALIKHGENSE